MKKILLPVDFGPKTQHLLSAAVAFAKEIQGRIELLHITPYDLGIVYGEMGAQFHPEVEESEMKYEQTELRKCLQSVEGQGVAASAHLIRGVAEELILKEATTMGVDYILIGSHGRSGFYDLFVGSLTKVITQKSPVPVLVIPCHD